VRLRLNPAQSHRPNYIQLQIPSIYSETNELLASEIFEKLKVLFAFGSEQRGLPTVQSIKRITSEGKVVVRIETTIAANNV